MNTTPASPESPPKAETPTWKIIVTSPTGEVQGTVKFTLDVFDQLAELPGIDPTAEMSGLLLTATEKILKHVLVPKEKRGGH